MHVQERRLPNESWATSKGIRHGLPCPLKGVRMDGHVGYSGEAAAPPSWAQSLLALLLTPGDQESVPRDILAEYRESRLPVLGQRRADLWYFQQVAGLLGRASLPWAAVLGALCSGRVLLDAWA